MITQNTNKTPWINQGVAGFFEYEIWINAFHIVARTKEDLQREVTINVQCRNYDEVSTYIKSNAWNMYESEGFSEEEKAKLPFSEYLDSKLNDEEYRKSIFNLLMEEQADWDVHKRTVHPYDISIDEIGYNEVQYTQVEVDELNNFIKQFPDALNQFELEDIYRYQNSNNATFAVFRESQRNAQTAVQQYENNLAVAELIVSQYEQQLAMEEQLLANAEMIVNLYEQLNLNSNSN